MFVEPSQKYFKERDSIRQQRYRTQTARGLLQYIEGHWDQARRSLKKSAKHSEMPLINYLAAADSAYEIGSREEADQLLAKAREVSPGGELAIGLAQSRMYLREEHYEEALAILQRLHVKAPDHPLILGVIRYLTSGLCSESNLRCILLY